VRKKYLDDVLSNDQKVLAYLKSRYPLYHLSNVFFRDVQFGIQSMLHQENGRISYVDAEKLARAFIAQLEKRKILIPIDGQTWVLNYPEFRKPMVKSPAKAASPAPPVPGARPVPASQLRSTGDAPVATGRPPFAAATEGRSGEVADARGS